MNAHDYEQLLAGALAGELSAEERARLEQALAADPQRAMEFAELARVRDLLQGVPIDTYNAPRAAALPLRPQTSLRTMPFARRLAGVLRYAAVALLAFTIGFWFRGGGGGNERTNGTNPDAPERLGGASGAAIAIEARGAIERQYAHAMSTFPASRSFTHALLSIARN